MEEDKKLQVVSALEGMYNATVGQLPVIGPVFTELAFGYSGRLKQERLNHFLEMLKTYFEEIGVEELNKDNILTEDFHDLFEAILSKVTKTKSEAKLERYRNIIVGQLKELKEFETIESYVEMISRLSDMHMLILIAYKNNGEAMDEHIERESEIKKQIRAKEDEDYKLDRDSEALTEHKIRNRAKRFTEKKSAEIEKNKLKLEDEIRALQEELMEEHRTYEAAQADISAEELSISQSEFDFLLNDLSTMYLLELHTHETKHLGQMKYYSITDFGKSFIEFIGG